MRFLVGESGESIEFLPSVLSHFDSHRQRRFWNTEAGGQLFARLTPGLVAVGMATGPRPTDFRTPLSYIPDREAEQNEILSLRNDGWHYVGDWHTHPQRVPFPSSRDIRTVKSTTIQSKLAISGVFMVIVGRDAFPNGLYVGVADAHDLYRLELGW
jgi:integrative and conjugative element protein (TIGR02256 family)